MANGAAIGVFPQKTATRRKQRLARWMGGHHSIIFNLCLLSLFSVSSAVLLFSGPVAARQMDTEWPVDRRAFMLRKFIVEKENVRIINELSQNAITPDHIITTRTGAEYFLAHPDRPPQRIAGSVLGTQYIEIIWNNESNAWIEFEKMGSRTGRIETGWLYPAQDMTAFVKAFANDAVILRDRKRKPIVSITPHTPVMVKKLDATRRYYYIQLEQPLTANGQTYSEGLVFYTSLYRKPEPETAPPLSDDRPATEGASPSLRITEGWTVLPDSIPAGSKSMPRLETEIRKILNRYIQLVDQISRHYLTLYGRTDMAPTFRVFQFRRVAGDPASDTVIAVHVSPNASSSIPLKDAEAALQVEIEQKVRMMYPAVETIRFVVE